ncbi:MAG: hypothetical protein ACK55Z_36300, partial [bacterium]
NNKGQTSSITKKLFNNQKCLWCFSDKFKIDFENLFKKEASKAIHGRQIKGNTPATRASDSHSELEDNEILFDENDDFKDKSN